MEVFIFLQTIVESLYLKDGNNHTVLMMNGEFTENDNTTRFTLVPKLKISV